MRNNTLVMLGASVAFGALAVILARGWISNALEDEFAQAPPPPLAALPAAPLPPALDTAPVLVAAHDVAFGDTLGRESFEVVDYPDDSVPRGTYDSADTLFATLEDGTTLRALTDIRAMEPIFSDRISGPGAKASLSARIRPGYVASSLSVDPVTGVGGFVVPGDLVDVMHVTQPDPDKRPDFFTSTILLQAVRVLGVDQNASTDSEDPEVARTVTLEVDRRDLQVLALGTETGTLSLALRGAGETSFVVADGQRSDRLGRASRASTPRVPVRRAPASSKSAAAKDDGRAKVKVVRGDAVQSVRVRREASVQSAQADMRADTQAAPALPQLAGGPRP